MYRFIYLILSIFASTPLWSQLSAPSRYSARSSAYQSSDSLYFFTEITTATLRADASADATFRWLGYNTASGNYDMELLTETGRKSELHLSGEGGYRVEITVAGTTSIYSCWCFSPIPAEVTIKQTEATCFLLSLEGEIISQPNVYYNPLTKQPIEEPQKLQYNWSAQPAANIYNPGLPIINGIDAPVENTRFELSVVNEAGRKVTANYDFEALAVAASFDVEPDDRDLPHELGDEAELSAPAVLRFDNTSKGNITSNEWIFKWKLDDATSTNRVFEKSPVYTFQQPGNYDMMLITTNERSGCSSESEVKTIKVMESYIEFPNAFTPNGDGVNDEFRPTFQSIKKYNITIYNRWGKKIYDSSDIETGWDGTINGQKAAEGVYFYMAEAEGYRKGERHRRKGSVTLLR